MASKELVKPAVKACSGGAHESYSSLAHSAHSASSVSQSSTVSSFTTTTCSANSYGGKYIGSIATGAVYATDYVAKENWLVRGNITREEEKKLFIGLNSRLSKYIETIRTLNLSKDELEKVIRTQKVTEVHLKENLEHMYYSQFAKYEGKIEDLNIAAAELVAKRRAAILDYEAQVRLVARLEKELHVVDVALRHAKSQVDELSAKIRSAEMRVTEIEQSNRSFKHGLLDTITVLKAKLAEKAAATGQWDGRIAVIRGELDLERKTNNLILEQVHKQQKFEMTQIIDHMRREFDARLLIELEALRKDFEARLKLCAHDLDAFHFKFGIVNFDSTIIVKDINAAKSECIDYSEKITRLEAAIAQHEALVAELQGTIRDLEAKAHYTKDFEAEYCHEFVKLEEEVNQMRRGYRHMLEVKIMLDSQINAYHTLLEEEEYRLSIVRYIPPADPHHDRGFIAKGYSNEDVAIDEINMDGNYIHLINKGHHDFHLSGWVLKAKGKHGTRTHEYRFGPDAKVLAQQSLYIWAPGCGRPDQSTHENIVAHNIVGGSWPKDDEVYSELQNPSGLKVAYLTCYYNIEDIKSGQALL